MDWSFPKATTVVSQGELTVRTNRFLSLFAYLYENFDVCDVISSNESTHEFVYLSVCKFRRLWCCQGNLFNIRSNYITQFPRGKITTTLLNIKSGRAAHMLIMTFAAPKRAIFSDLETSERRNQGAVAPKRAVFWCSRFCFRFWSPGRSGNCRVWEGGGQKSRCR